MHFIKPVGVAAGSSHYQILTSSPSSPTSWKRRRRLLLWSILLLQFGFILCFWLMQFNLSGHLNEPSAAANAVMGSSGSRINFIKTEALYDKPSMRDVTKSANLLSFQWPSRDLKFSQDFILLQNTYNISEAEKQMFGDNSLWCFKQGTSNESRLQTSYDSSHWPDSCLCLSDWHGQDCGQPEVIWRALMTAKAPFKLQNPTQNEAHRLVYMIKGSMLSMDLLELQIEAVIKVVDYFILYYTGTPTSSSKYLKTLKHRLKQLLPERNYIVYTCRRNVALKPNCSAAEAYRIFRQQQLQSNAIKPTDLFVYTDDKTILGHRALNFLKYYSLTMPAIEFRLKYNVYGFYWQHPELTTLKGLIGTFQHVDNCNADPEYLAAMTAASSAAMQRGAFVIGDLNHFGGWFCEYCQQPDEIINQLQAGQSELLQRRNSTPITGDEKSISAAIAFPADKKHHALHIDSAHVQQLIAVGVYLKDGKTQMQKVRRFSDKYFAPRYASQQSWKYGHLLVNIYESLEDLLVDESDDGTI